MALFWPELDTIGQTYSYIFDKWLPQTAYKRAGTPDFEYYPDTFDPEHKKEMAIYMPVAK